MYKYMYKMDFHVILSCLQAINIQNSPTYTSVIEILDVLHGRRALPCSATISMFSSHIVVPSGELVFGGTTFVSEHEINYRIRCSNI
jgi:hypothetical protein